jgi:hypothetical protein
VLSRVLRLTTAFYHPALLGLSETTQNKDNEKKGFLVINGHQTTDGNAWTVSNFHSMQRPE